MICTFYSYKGGVGRSMAMANVADIIARRGLRVLMVDFDLEAPGLEQFFRINHDGVRRNPGLLNLLLDYKQSMSVGGRGAARVRDVTRYIVPVYPSLGGSGRLDLLPAGQRHDPEHLARYALDLRTFDWQDFYFNWQGERFFEWLRRSLTPAPYDLVLVDSRTGVTEMGGICGYQLADAIVMLCAANHQNVDGTASMLRDFRSPAVEALRRDRALDIVVVPARIEQGDPDLLASFFQRFGDAFSSLVPAVLAERGIRFRDLTIPYEPLFAFEEQVVSDPGEAALRKRIGTAFEGLADAVALLVAPAAYRGGDAAAGAAPAAAAPAPEPGVAATRYDVAKRFADFDVFLSFAAEPELLERLGAALAAHGLRVFTERHGTGKGADWQAVMEDSLFHSKVLVLGLGPGPAGENARRLLRLAQSTSTRGAAMPVVPVLLPGAASTVLAEVSLERFQAVDMRHGAQARELERLHLAVRALLDPAPEVESSTRVPYSGVAAWSENDSDLFFGREALVSQVLAALERDGVVSIVGPSGSGKTSLIQAGVVPALRRLGTGAATWSILNASLVDLQQPAPALLDQVRAAPSAGQPGSLESFVAGAARSAVDNPLLLVVDQLEDALELGDPGLSLAQRLGAALELARETPGFRAVLITRSDALPALAAVRSLAPFLGGENVRVSGMSVEEMRRAIEGPVERVGAAFEPGLVERILRDMEGEPDALSFMQELLADLWARRRAGWLTNEAFDTVGGLGGVIVRCAEDVFERLDDVGRDDMKRLLLGLVRTDSGGENSRRRQPLEALLPAAAKGSESDRTRYNRLVETLIDARLLIARVTHSGKRAVEPVHDALFRGWPRLRAWLEDDRQFLHWRDHVAEAANEWDRHGRPASRLLHGGELAKARDWSDERARDLSGLQASFIRASARRRNRAAMLGMAMLAVIAVVTTGASFVAWHQSKSAEAALEDTEVARARAEFLRDKAIAASIAAVERGKRLEADVAAAGKETEKLTGYIRELERKVASLGQSAQQQAESDRQAREAKATAQRIYTTLNNLKGDAMQQVQVVQPRVYVHYARAEQQELVGRLVRALKEDGVSVPSADLTPSPPAESQLRYFSKDRTEASEAAKVAELLSKLGGSAVQPWYTAPGKTEVRPRHYELWLSPGAGAAAK